MSKKSISTESKSKPEVRYPSGSVVKITGLQSEKGQRFNGCYGVVKGYDSAVDRHEVLFVPGKGRAGLSIRTDNLSQESVIGPTDSAFRQAQRYQHVCFWPRVEQGSTGSQNSGGAARSKSAIPVHAFNDWPSAEYEETTFLRTVLRWSNPQLYSGIESRDVSKPDFVMYFDADDVDSPVNTTAVDIMKLLPSYELSKMPRDFQGRSPRGACVLIYSPMMSMMSSSFGGGGGLFMDDLNGLIAPPDPSIGRSSEPSRPKASADPKRQFSLHELRDVLLFQESSDAKVQYMEHDNPMHRMFG